MKLKKVMSNEAFGFEFTISEDNVILLRPVNKYHCRLQPFRDNCEPNVVHIYYRFQFGSDKMKNGIVRGYMMRLQDGSNMPSDQIGKDFTRLFLELRTAGFSREQVKTQFRSCERKAPFQIPADFGVWDVSNTEVDLLKMGYDISRRALQLGQARRWR